MANFVLASASPRRRDLLAAVGLKPEVAPADVDESVLEGEAPDVYGLRVATDKARAGGHPSAVLAADTVVALDGRSLGKPASAEEAKAILQALSGRVHQVYTAVVLLAQGELYQRLVTTEVRFRTLSSAEIEAYVGTGEPMDKAGAYGIQGQGGAMVAELRGSYSNVVGLPVEETLALLREGGVLS